MTTPENAHKFVRIAIHMWVSFVFLTLFFYLFIKNTEQKVIDEELSIVIEDKIPVFLKYLDDIPGNNINWNEINKIFEEKDKYKEKDQKIKEHNDKILKIAISICIFTFVLLVAIILYFTLQLNYNIGLKEMIFEISIIISLVTILQVLFFLHISIKYSHTKPSQLISNVIDRVKYQINKQI